VDSTEKTKKPNSFKIINQFSNATIATPLLKNLVVSDKLENLLLLPL